MYYPENIQFSGPALHQSNLLLIMDECRSYLPEKRVSLLRADKN